MDLNAVLQQIVAQQGQPAPAPTTTPQATLTPPPSGGGRQDPAIVGAMLAAQLADGLKTQAGVRAGETGRPGAFFKEVNPLAAPFTHGGLPMEIAGGALVDALKNAWMKSHHWSSGSMNNANLLQTLLSLLAAGGSHYNPMPGAAASTPSLQRNLQMQFPSKR